MDHSSAHLTEFKADPMTSTVIESEFTHEEKEISLVKGENFMHTKEQHKQSEYYHKLGDVIRNYEEVILFGPTEAKSELLNILREQHLFEKIKINIRQTDKMTEHQQHSFVKEYFTQAG